MTFRDETLFVLATFAGVTFGEATFERFVSFGGVNFGGKPWLDGAMFVEGAVLPKEVDPGDEFEQRDDGRWYNRPDVETSGEDRAASPEVGDT